MKKILVTGLLAALLAPTITKPVENSTWSKFFLGMSTTAGTVTHLYKYNNNRSKVAGICTLSFLGAFYYFAHRAQK
ncbi:MAG: hypothetical protein WC707_04535 [Candidatus Babeliaceae bacterium]